MSPHPHELLSAHALGALDDDDRRTVEAHLAMCESCREDHARLAALVPLLDVTSAATSDPAPSAAPARLEEQILAALPRGRRRWAARPRFALPPVWTTGLAGVAAGTAATLVLLAATGSFDDAPQSPTASVRLTGAGGAGVAVLRPQATGTAVDLRVDALPATRGPQVYEVWFVRPGGRVSAGTFTSTGGPALRVALSTAASASAYERVGITREPDGLDPARNGPNVLGAPLPH